MADDGNDVGGRTSETMDRILPVVGDMEMVAGDWTSESSGSVRTALVDTKTTRGSGNECAGSVMPAADVKAELESGESGVDRGKETGRTEQQGAVVPSPGSKARDSLECKLIARWWGVTGLR